MLYRRSTSWTGCRIADGAQTPPGLKPLEASHETSLRTRLLPRPDGLDHLAGCAAAFAPRAAAPGAAQTPLVLHAARHRARRRRARRSPVWQFPPALVTNQAAHRTS